MDPAGVEASDSQIHLDQSPDLHESITIKQRRSPIATVQIAFNCPNGHRLKGPISLQGRLGECPHCEAKFRIPAFEDSTDPDLGSVDLDAPKLNSASESHIFNAPPSRSRPADTSRGSSLSMPGFPAALGADNEESEKAELADDSAAVDSAVNTDAIQPVDRQFGYSRWAEEPRAEPSCHPLSRLFQTLWEGREHGDVIELYLSSGDILKPERWSAALSGAVHAVFADEKSDGTWQIDAVAWDDIQRVSVQGITELPSAFF